MTYLNFKKIKQELITFIRNSDIFTVTQRSVTTETLTGTFTSTTEHIIDRTNIKNIRSIKVGITTLTYGTDYDYDVNFLQTTIKTKITFTVAQTGTYEIVLDYGTDKIFPDFPRNDLTITSFPRIGLDVVSTLSNPGGLGKVIQNEFSFTVVFYDFKQEDIDDYISLLREKFIDKWDMFYYLKGVIYPLSVGPLIKSTYGQDKIMQKNVDFKVILNFER